MNYEIDHITREVVQKEFIEALKVNGLMVAPKELVLNGIDLRKDQDLQLKKSYLSAWSIEKYKLLGGKSANTVKNMVKDGRIKSHECFQDKNGVLQIMTSAIKRLNNE